MIDWVHLLLTNLVAETKLNLGTYTWTLQIFRSIVHERLNLTSHKATLKFEHLSKWLWRLYIIWKFQNINAHWLKTWQRRDENCTMFSFALSKFTHLSIEIEKIKGKHTHLNFDVGNTSILQSHTVFINKGCGKIIIIITWAGSRKGVTWSRNKFELHIHTLLSQWSL